MIQSYGISCRYIYIYICVCVCVCVYIYIYIYITNERNSSNTVTFSPHSRQAYEFHSAASGPIVVPPRPHTVDAVNKAARS
jgi:hypothetical protein